MENLTVNQIILLLEIYRGAVVGARQIGTYLEDLEILYRKGLIKLSKVEEDRVSEKGEELIKYIKAIVVGSLNITSRRNQQG